MTDLIEAVQKQDPGSALVELIELELSSSTVLYFHSGIDDDLTTVQFRDKRPISNVYTARSYTAIPVEIKGIEKNTDGASSRPTLTMANILATFSGALGTLTNKDLIGKRILRRQTLKKYLVGESDDSGASSPPIEFPSEKFLIDRVAGENKVAITFELASVMDLEGVKLPGRIVVGKYCTWEYQGVQNNRGGCTWRENSQIPLGTTSHKAYFTIDDEPILLSTETFTTWSAGTTNANTLVAKTEEINSEDYTIRWRANVDTTSEPERAVKNEDWTRVRIYEDYDNTEDYVYNRDDYQYVESGNTIWRLAKTSTGNAPSVDSIYWVRGDVCGKILDSCKCRFQWQPKSGSTTVPSFEKDTSIPMPFGAFPGSEKYR